MKKLFKKVITTLAIAAVAITSVAILSPKNVRAEEGAVRVISDDNATAYVNEDGSGYIELYKSFSEKDQLTSIGDIALKDIITFNDGGYIDSFYTRPFYYIRDMTGEGPFYNYKICVHGRGPKGLTSGSGHLHFTDESDDTYDLSIWLHSEQTHDVSYDSDQPTIVTIRWNS